MTFMLKILDKWSRLFYNLPMETEEKKIEPIGRIEERNGTYVYVLYHPETFKQKEPKEALWYSSQE